MRALPDFGNSKTLNKGDDYNYRAVTAMFQHACTISHVKEVETDDGKLYTVDLAKTFAIAKEVRLRRLLLNRMGFGWRPLSGHSNT